LVLFPYRLTKGCRDFARGKGVRENFPLAWDYLKSNELNGGTRARQVQRQRLVAAVPEELGVLETPKVMLPYMIQRLSAFTTAVVIIRQCYDGWFWCSLQIRNSKQIHHGFAS